MNPYLLWSIGTTLVFVPTYLCFFLLMRDRKRRSKRSRMPFRELKRPPGEWLRLKISDLEEALLNQILFFVFMPMGFAIWILATRPRGAVGFWFVITLVAISFVVAAIWSPKLARRVQELSTHRIGWEGERFVGEELNSLMAEGFLIFHDLAFDGYNIDHAIVGRQGLFAVETKTRRKPIDPSGEKRFVVYFNGENLDWGTGPETDDLNQAASNARDLSKWVSGAVGRSVFATAILTLPGWWVERKNRCQKVFVLNPKEIGGFCKRMPAILDSEMVLRIAHQLNERCRLDID